MDDKSDERKFELLMREIDRRFEGEQSEKSRNARRKLASQLNSIKRLQAIQKSKTKEAESLTKGEKSEKEAISSVASSCALIAALELANEQRRIEQEMKGTDQDYQNDSLGKTYKDVVDRMSKK
jgi:hypothetical protein